MENGDCEMIERVTVDGRLLSVIIRAGFRKEGIEFFTPDEFSQQLAYMNRPAGYVIPPHVHNEVAREVAFTKETLFVRSGKVRIDYYDDDRTYLQSRMLLAGDVVLLAFGGHGFEMIEPSEIVEVKQGPYTGDRDKTRFEPLDRADIRIVEND
jgi:hypothetical protein